MEYLLFTAYLVLFAWLVTRVSFFSKAGLNNAQLIILFLLKVMAGIFYGWIGLYYGNLAQMVDTWGYHAEGIREYQLLQQHPGEYFTNLFHDPYGNGLTTLFDSSNSYWNDLKGNVFIKILSVFDVFSFGHYYVNVIFYSFLTLFGPLALFRVMQDVFPGKRSTLLLSVFLVPSFLFWTSGLHKEGLLFNGVGLCIYALYFGMKEKRFGWKRVLSLLMGLTLVFALRNFLLALLVPAMLTWLVSMKWPYKSFRIFTAAYLLFCVFFFTARYLNPHLDFPQAVVNKQQEFKKLMGGSTVPIRDLEPTVWSFVENMPQAITLSSVRPYPGDVQHILSLAAAVEIDLILLLFLLFLFWRTPARPSKSLMNFFLFFSFSVLLSIGFSNNNLGAIVRYRSILLPLLIMPMAAQIDWNRIYKGISKYISN